MKNLYRILAAAVLAIAFGGCTGGDGTFGSQQPSGQDNNNGGSPGYQESVIPPQSQGFGLQYDISGYFLPYTTLNKGSAYKNFDVTVQDSNGYFTQTQTLVKRYLEGKKDDLDRPIVNIFEGETANQILVEKYIVDDNRLSVFSYDANGLLTNQEQYPRYIQVNGDLLRNENGACVLKEEIQNFDMSDGYIPVQANPNGQYNSVLHFYCGTSDGMKIDRYYADGWGQILVVKQSSDGITTYSVFDQSSYQIQ